MKQLCTFRCASHDAYSASHHYGIRFHSMKLHYINIQNLTCNRLSTLEACTLLEMKENLSFTKKSNANRRIPAINVAVVFTL
jgi:hypothetical protein